MLLKTSDGVLEKHVELAPDGTLTARLVQPTRKLILDGLAELRKNPHALKPHNKTDMGMGLEYTMPKADYYTMIAGLRKMHPGMDNKQLNEQITKWLRANGHMYKVRD